MSLSPMNDLTMQKIIFVLINASLSEKTEGNVQTQTMAEAEKGA